MHRQMKHCNEYLKGWVQKKPFQKDLIPERHLPKMQDAYMRKKKKTKVK